MALITFLSDFGEIDHYTGVIKAKIHSLNAEQRIIDISHHIKPFNLPHGSFVLKSAFREFPEGTVHLVAVDSSSRANTNYIALKLEGHYFVGADNGLLSLISEKEPTEVIKIDTSDSSVHFAEKEILAPIAVKLANGAALSEVGSPFSDMKRLLNKKSRASRQKISGHVIHVDQYGNLITNIELRDFEILSKNKKVSINYGRAFSNQIHKSYDSVVHGESFHIFNSLGLLEIGINMGHGAELLGLDYDSPVTIIFEE